MNDWNQEFHNISVKCLDQLVQIKNDEALRSFLEEPDTTGALLISDYVHELYERECGCPLAITRDSLAIEILGHVYLEFLADALKLLQWKEIQKLVDEVKKRTDIIDCGEAEIDSNRIVWDSLATVGLKSVIYRLCGKRA